MNKLDQITNSGRKKIDIILGNKVGKLFSVHILDKYCIVKAFKIELNLLKEILYSNLKT